MLLLMVMLMIMLMQRQPMMSKYLGEVRWGRKGKKNIRQSHAFVAR